MPRKNISQKATVKTGTGKKKPAAKNKKKFLWFGLLAVFVLVNIGAVGLTAYESYRLKQVEAKAGGWTSLGVYNSRRQFQDNFSGTKVAICYSNGNINAFIVRPAGSTWFRAGATKLAIGNRGTSWSSSWRNNAQLRTFYSGVSDTASIRVGIKFGDAGTKTFSLLSNGSDATIRNIARC
jgi:hypothetical protein